MSMSSRIVVGSFFFTATVAVGSFLIGCGPSLHAELRSAHAYKVSADCAQGPFVLHATALGSPWGEDMTLESRGGRINGHVTVTVAGQGESTSSVGGADNHACMLSDAERGPAATATTPNETTTPGTMTPPGTPPPGTPPPPVVTTPGVPTLGEIPMNLVDDLPQAMVVAQIHREVNKIEEKGVVLPKGADIKIELWSEQPNDFSRTYLVLKQSAMVPPDGNDVKWQAHLDEVKADDEKKAREAAEEAKKRQEEADAKERERQRCWVLKVADSKCHDEGFKTAFERAAADAEDSRCYDLALKNATDAKCREIGWRNDNERPDYMTHPAQPRPPQQATATLTATTPSGPEKHAPDRPPPAPQGEAQTPKPSEHADWVPGSWQWSGFDWVWVGGGWRVPEADRQQKLTATAPSAPPAPQVEARSTQPVASAVWTDGYWHWQGGRWVWIAGRWAVPPRAGATWRPSVWVPEGVQVRLDPGGWILH